MGRRGPIAKSAASKKRAGNPGKRPIAATVKAESKAPDCPTWLDEEARAEWKRVVKELLAQGTLAAADRAVLSAYCEAWSEFVAIMTELAKCPSRVVWTEKGYPVANPLIAQKNKAVARIESAAKQLGLTPAARLRIGTESPSGSGAPSALAEQIQKKRQERAKRGR
jgi:P27 family predicted phage terminase small subunit